jgi:lipopolysaccharide assembly outer membrane protein LptD (OstA)
MSPGGVSMRRTLIVALVIVGAVITGSAQGAPNGLALPRGTKVAADRVESSKEDVAVFSGNVTISISGATATADSAIFHQSSQTFELEGHVQLKVAPPAK